MTVAHPILRMPLISQSSASSRVHTGMNYSLHQMLTVMHFAPIRCTSDRTLQYMLLYSSHALTCNHGIVYEKVCAVMLLSLHGHSPFSLSPAVMALQPWYCNHGTATMVLQPWYCNHGTATLQLWYCSHSLFCSRSPFCSHGTAAMALQPWYCSHGTAAMALQPWYCSRGTAAMVLSCDTAAVALRLWHSCHGTELWHCSHGTAAMIHQPQHGAMNCSHGTAAMALSCGTAAVVPCASRCLQWCRWGRLLPGWMRASQMTGSLEMSQMLSSLTGQCPCPVLALDLHTGCWWSLSLPCSTDLLVACRF